MEDFSLLLKQNHKMIEYLESNSDLLCDKYFYLDFIILRGILQSKKEFEKQHNFF